jgi:uncharacterized lipoprotein YbaY
MPTGAILLVSGVLPFHGKIHSFSDATLFVYLEDVSLQDAPSKIVARQVISNISHTRGTSSCLEFALSGELPEARAHYSVRAHVSLHGQEEIQLGDLITMQSYPVITFGNPNFVSVNVREVK